MSIAINYISNSENKMSRSYLLMNQDNEQIGYIEGYLNDSGNLVSVVNIFDEYKKQGLGYKVFKKVYDELNAEIPITSILGAWHSGGEFAHCENGMSTNMKLFLECIKNENEVTCAFKTPTGKWALKLGYDKCEILEISNSEVRVLYKKNNSTL